MTPEESNAKLRRLVPWIVGAIVAIVLGGTALAFRAPQPETKVSGLLIAADVAFTLVLLFALWRALGRKR